MFFCNILEKSKVLGEVWRLGNNIEENISEENASLPTICENISRYVDSEDSDVKRRLSLRTSAVLLKGASKLYKKQMQELFGDMAKLDETIVMRNRTHIADTESPASSSDVETPEQMMRQVQQHADISIEAYQRESSCSPPAAKKSNSFSSNYIDSIYSINTKRYSDSLESSDQPAKKELLSTNQSRFDEKSDSSDISQPQLSDEISNNQSDRETDTQSKRTNDDPSSTSRSKSSRSNQTTKTYQAPQSTRQVTDVRSQSSPTYTDLFDLVVGLSNNNEKTIHIDVTNSTKSTNKSSERNICINNCDTTDKNTDSQKTDEITDNSHRVTELNTNLEEESQKSFIFMSSKKSAVRKSLRSKRRSKTTQKNDQATQTDSDSCNFHMSERDDNITNRNLPFGYLLIHDSYESRIPSKIIYSLLHESVKRL